VAPTVVVDPGSNPRAAGASASGRAGCAAWGASRALLQPAARALGLIAAPPPLLAWQTAAQADEDREVRHSAQFAAEVIRGNLHGQPCPLAL
jgi:hypothetical protein